MAFGQNIEEILLKVRAEGKGEVDALKAALREAMGEIDGMYGKIAKGEDVVKNTRGISSKARDVKLLEDAIRAVDPAWQKFIQSADEAGRVVAESFRKQAEAAKALADAREGAAQRILAAESLASQKAKALQAQEAADREEMAARTLAAGMLAAQRSKALSDQEVADRQEAAARILAAESLASQKAKALADQEVERRNEAAAKILAAGELAAQKTKALADQEVAARAEAAERILAAEGLANQKARALRDQETARRLEAAERILAAESLDAQKTKALLDQEAERRKEAAERTLAAGALADQKSRALLEQEVARREDAAARILAAEQLADQKAKALSDAEVARRTEASDRILAAEKLAIQKKESLQADAAARAALATQRQEAVAKQAYDMMMKYGYGENHPFWSSKAIEGTHKQARAYGEMKDRAALLAKEFDRGHEGAKKFSYGLLNVAHAFQDASYGMGAVLNNIPLVVQAFGGGPGLAGTIMIAGVVIEQTMPKIKEVARQLGMIRDPALESARSIDQMKEKINALVEKPWKVDVDFRAIEKAKDELAQLEGRLQAYNAAMAKQTPSQEKVGKAVLEAVSEFAGDEVGDAGSAKNLAKIGAELARKGKLNSLLDVEANRSEDMKRARELRKGVATQEQLIREGVFQPDELGPIRAQAARERAEAASLEAKARNEAMGRVLTDTIGGALKGNSKELENLIRILEMPEAKALLSRGNAGLGIRPVDPDFVEMLRQSRPGFIKEVAEEEAADKRKEANRQAQDQREEAMRQDRIKKGRELEQQLNIEQGVGARAFDRARDIKARKPVGFEFKKEPMLPERPDNIRLDNATRFAMQNFNLNQGQAGVVARRALQMEDQGVPPWMAAQRALGELGNRNQRMFNPRQGRRKQQGAGFRSIAPADPIEGGGGGGGPGGGLPLAAAMGAVAGVNGGLVAGQQMLGSALGQVVQHSARQDAQLRAMRQQLPSLLRAPMPMMPR